ncbi:extracellular solute-binding protein [Clostridium sp. AM58-1XD]|uniref:extracellular solute-binding protein n=1 Tax=Clostridium sp. AM58-1XD TaxID=2292307 RepID=UPI000E4F5EE3|nr:extracellular solute-binding protein [Clostridium sp. AM58-1XD]RGY96284.1 extracellular solute-binding protein [Clostridium sp. AM58-1XD]
MNGEQSRFKRFIQNFYLVFILIFLYAPILIMMVLSFNSSKSRTQWGGFTLKWYSEMFQNATIMDALYNTLLIAFISALVATVIGTVASLGINAMKRLPKTVVLGVNNIPMLNSEIVTGISLMLTFIAFGISLGFKTILLAHITFNIPYVILSVMPKLKQTDKYTYEAAMDLGAGPVQAFFKVVFPDIMPGVLSGFLLAFTMSLDDFIITHFTRGAGINTLSTLIYSEVRRGIKPSMYALSSIIFVTVLALLLITNFSPEKSGKRPPAGMPVPEEVRKRRKNMETFRKGLLVAAAFFIVVSVSFTTYKHYINSSSNELYVYNWGEYIDESVIDQFEQETGIQVTYDLFETNEEMYPVIEAGAVQYDVVCPSDYMIQKMAENGLLAEINFENVPNIKEIDPVYMDRSKSFDPENKYSVPYTWGTVGILYNTELIKQLGVPAPTKWADLWDERYKGEILMQDSVRDAFMVALKELGYSMNTKSPEELAKARDLLIRQKPLVQAYVIDQVRDKMIGEEAAISVIYSGEMLYIQEETAGSDFTLEYVLPEEGTNIWIDSWVIPANAKNKENAEKWINFLCRPDIAKKNFEYITYATPNKGAFDLLDPEVQENKAVFPDVSRLQNCEVFNYMGDETDSIYNEMWKEVKSN